jgi:hypothetical protein
MIDLTELAEIVEGTTEKVVAWANSPDNNGPFSEEIYRTNVQIFGALTMLADALRARTKNTPDSEKDGA